MASVDIVACVDDTDEVVACVVTDEVKWVSEYKDLKTMVEEV